MFKRNLLIRSLEFGFPAGSGWINGWACQQKAPRVVTNHPSHFTARLRWEKNGQLPHQSSSVRTIQDMHPSGKHWSNFTISTRHVNTDTGHLLASQFSQPNLGKELLTQPEARAKRASPKFPARGAPGNLADHENPRLFSRCSWLSHFGFFSGW